jgi:protein-tyrosine phosphatase
MKFAQILAVPLIVFGGMAVAQGGLEGQPNFRDMGGYPASDGRVIREGRLYRSGHLANLSDADVEMLDALGIETVVNFLTPEEIASGGADRLPQGVREVFLPVTGEVDYVPDASNQLIDARKTGDFRQFPPEFNRAVHRELVGGIAAGQYAALFEILADETNYPVLVHCSHGIHRTGTAMALVMSALGVEWDAVRSEYLISNEARAEVVAPRIAQLNELAAAIEMSDADRAANSAGIEAFYVLQPGYIDASRKAAVAEYGSLPAYLAEGLGVDGELKAAIEDQMLD